MRHPGTLTHEQAPGDSSPTLDYAGQEQCDEAANRLQLVSSSSGSQTTQAGSSEETVITSIRATDVVLGLGRIPAGFYAMVNHSGLEWKTENKRLSVNDHIVEWDGPIPLPSDLSAIVSLGVHASFELQPILGDGEQLGKVTITVSQLLDRSLGDPQFTFLRDGDDAGRPCSSISVRVGRHGCEDNHSESPLSKVHCSTAGSRTELEVATNLGHSALLRYKEHGDKLDLERSIEQFKHALDICLLDHPGRAVVESNMASAKLMHGLRGDSDISLDVPLGLYRNVLAARPAGHPDRPFTLIQLAAVLFARIERRWDGDEPTLAVELLQEAINLSSAESHENQAAVLMLRLHSGRTVGIIQASGPLSIEQGSAAGVADTDLWALSVQLLHRFEQAGELADLQQAISASVRFLLSIPLYDERYVAGLGNLGLALFHRYSQLGNLDDLEQAILRLELAVGHTEGGDPNESVYLHNLSKCLCARFKRLGDRKDIEQAILRQEDAVHLTPDGPDRPGRLQTLGNCFLIRFRRIGELSDLEQAISSYKDAVDLTAHGHPDKAGYFYNLGSFLQTRFEYLGDLADLEQAISMQSNAASSFPDSHPNKPICLDNLGNSLVLRFAHLSDPNDLEQAISRHRTVVGLTPDDPASLNNLGNSLLTRFEYAGEQDDLEEAISRFREADRLTPDGHADKPRRLNNLGDSLLVRFERFGELDDLGQAISKQQDAVNLTPDDHADKRIYLNNLGNSLSTRFDRLGELGDLEQAISRYRDAVRVTRDGHTDKPACLNNLAEALCTRFERLGELRDLNQAISRLEDAVKLIPDEHSDRPSCLCNLGQAFLTRFEHHGELRDLEQAISNSEEAVKLTHEEHPNKPILLNTLGNCLRARFERLGEKDALEQAVSRHEEAVHLTPDGHPYRPGRLHSLGKSLFARFKCLGELSDIEKAISRQKDAVHITPDGHPNKPGFMSNLGDSLRARFEHLGELGDLEQAMSLYSHAACSSTGPVANRFGASQQWTSCARTLQHHSLLGAYSTAVALLPQLAWIGLSLAHRYRELAQGADVVREAAAAALDKGYPETAVEWLEQGRSIVWGELFQLRSSYEELSSAHPDHARRLQELSAALEHAGAVRERSLSLLSGSEDTEDAEPPTIKSLEEQTNRHRTLAIARDQVLQEIRRLPGFERFLLHKEFSQLRSSAHSGPVVILNAAESRCDALIVLADMDNVLHVPLPNFTFQRSLGLRNAVKSLVGPARVARDVERVGEPVKRGHLNWEPLLSTLWNGVVKPILDSLAYSTPGNLSRIFWCPTGPFTFLPIHAAGIYGTKPSEPGHKVSDFVVSSYTPTLSTLVPSHSLDATSLGHLRFLVVPQPQSDGQFHLRGVGVELQHIRNVIENSASAPTFVEPTVGSVEEVLGLMKEADWVHFACHGIQDADHPTDSGLCLADRRRLKLSDIIALSRPRGGLAFLSACQTATGDKALSDEAIHIAAGMLFAGYGGVVGTMWSISDRLAPVVTRDVYEQLLCQRDSGMRPDYREAAQALQNAVGRLQDEGAPFVEWLPFIHVGL